jgi:hypothetical protein
MPIKQSFIYPDLVSMPSVSSHILLWHDFVRGQRTHIELFWENAVYSKTAETPYRYILKRKLREMGKDKFMKMFDVTWEYNKIVIVFTI